jgi:hypothetical protein
MRKECHRNDAKNATKIDQPDPSPFLHALDLVLDSGDVPATDGAGQFPESFGYDNNCQL